MSARHARLHKRGHSASAPTSSLSPVADQGAFTFDRSHTTKLYEDPWTETQRPVPAAASSHPLKIKPYLRKLSSKETSGLDLSRPAAENDLTGLGILEYGAYSRSISDVNFTPANPRNRHARSTSNQSQYSTSSGMHRPTPLPSIRQTPQLYSPPIANSSPPSILGSELEGDDIMSDDEVRLKQNSYDPARRSGSMSSAQGTSLRMHSNNSSTRLAPTYSQSAASLTSPASCPPRARGDTLKSIDTTTSPSSRTSFDQTYRFIRGGRDSPVDPASRAASIRAARQKFEQEQRAKELKYEKEAHKQQERDYKKQLKKEDLQRRKSETIERNEMNRTRTVSDDSEKTPRPSLGGRPSIGGRQYSDHRQAHSHSLPKLVTTVDPEKTAMSAAPKVTKSRAVKGRWLRFVTWLKTRLLRLSGR